METKDILQAAIQAGKAIMEVYDSPQSEWQVESKADNSPLTLADRRSHEIISEALKNSPYLMISEEGKIRKYAERNHHRHVWIVDPLDGTKEFIKRNGEFTVNIALVEDGLPIFGVIYAPALHILYYGNARDGAFKCEVNPETGEWGEPQELPLARRKKGDKFRGNTRRSGTRQRGKFPQNLHGRRRQCRRLSPPRPHHGMGHRRRTSHRTRRRMSGRGG